MSFKSPDPNYSWMQGPAISYAAMRRRMFFRAVMAIFGK